MEEKLLKYNEIPAEIARLKWKIKVIENQDIQANSGGIDPTGVRAQGYKSSPIENQVAKNLDNITKYKRKIEELEAELEMLDSMINTLKGIEKQVIELRFKKLLKWESIAVSIDRDISRAKTIKDNAIAKMDELYQKQD